MMPTASPTPGNDRSAAGVVYGYIRAEEPNEMEIALLRKEMGAYCQQHGMRLGQVFVDRDVKPEQTSRLGFTALLDVLCFPDSVGVVVPSRDHLSTQEGIQRALTSKIMGTASRVFSVYDET